MPGAAAGAGGAAPPPRAPGTQVRDLRPRPRPHGVLPPGAPFTPPGDCRDHDDVTGAAPGQPRQPRQRRGQPQAGAARRGGAGDRGGQEQDAAGRRAQGGAAADKGEDSVATV